MKHEYFKGALNGGLAGCCVGLVLTIILSNINVSDGVKILAASLPFAFAMLGLLFGLSHVKIGKNEDVRSRRIQYGVLYSLLFAVMNFGCMIWTNWGWGWHSSELESALVILSVWMINGAATGFEIHIIKNEEGEYDKMDVWIAIAGFVGTVVCLIYNIVLVLMGHTSNYDFISLGAIYATGGMFIGVVVLGLGGLLLAAIAKGLYLLVYKLIKAYAGWNNNHKTTLLLTPIAMAVAMLVSWLVGLPKNMMGVCILVVGFVAFVFADRHDVWRTLQKINLMVGHQGVDLGILFTKLGALEERQTSLHIRILKENRGRKQANRRQWNKTYEYILYIEGKIAHLYEYVDTSDVPPAKQVSKKVVRNGKVK